MAPQPPKIVKLLVSSYLNMILSWLRNQYLLLSSFIAITYLPMAAVMKVCKQSKNWMVGSPGMFQNTMSGSKITSIHNLQSRF